MQTHNSNQIKKLKFGLMAIILLVLCLGLFILTVDFKEKHDNIISNQRNLMNTRIKTILGMHEKSAKIVYETIINKKVLFILKDLTESNIDSKRRQLLNKVGPIYKKIVKNNIRQLHFHLPDNTSFLRMHRPEKFGDDLTNIRESIRITNKEIRPIQGFEEGRIYNGYRFVFPLLLSDEHLGSVETSFSIQSVLKELSRIDPGASFNFLMRKEVVDKKLFKDEKSNYASYTFSNLFYQDKEIQKSFLIPKGIYEILNLNKKEIHRKLVEYEKYGNSIVPSFSMVHSGILSIFHPIYNISNQYVGLIVSHKKFPLLNQLRNTYFKFILLITVLSLILLSTIHYLFKYIKRDIDYQRLNVLRATTISLHHEVRNPLAIISSTCSFIKKKHGETIDDPKLFNSINDSIKRITDILDKLTNIEKVELTAYTDESDMIDIKSPEDKA